MYRPVILAMLWSLQEMNLLDFVIQTTKQYIEQMPKSQRKKYGQFFTSKETAVFMAELFEVPVDKEQLHILDAELARAYCLLR